MRHDPEGVIRSGAQRFRCRLPWVMALGIFLILGTVLALAIGCGVRPSGFGPGSDSNGGFRWAAADTARLLRNAQYFNLMGQPELGLKELEVAHRQDPGNLQVADALAHYYEELGMGERAQTIYRDALAQAPDNPALQNNLCFSYYQAGDLSQAETCYRKALDRQPHNQAARNNLGLVLCRQGRQDEARRLWQETEGEAAAAQKLGNALIALGMAGEIHYAQPTRPHPERKPSLPPVMAPSQPEARPLTASSGPPPARGSLPAVDRQVKAATQTLPSPPVVAPEQIAPTLPPPQMAPDAHPRKLPAAKPVEAQVTPPAPISPQVGSDRGPGNHPNRSLPLRGELAMTPPAPAPAPRSSTPEKSGRATTQAMRATPPAPQEAAGKFAIANPQAKPRRHLTARELIETNIAILNGNGIQDLAREIRSQLSLEGYRVAAINNFRDFGVARTTIYYRPDSEHVAIILKGKFFPGAEFEVSSRLADNIDIKVVLGHDLCPQPHAEVLQAHKARL
jgi:Tfp pilus assembly protein PilF